MLEEQSGSGSQEEKEQDVQTEKQDVDQSLNDVDQEKVYSKKQRQRAQNAEAELEKSNARIKKLEEDQLTSQNKYQELWERDKEEAEWARGYKKTRKADLLNSLPEEDQADFADLKVDQLEKVVSKYKSLETKQETMKAVPGGVNPNVKPMDFTTMTAEERKDNWDQIVASFANKHKKN